MRRTALAALAGTLMAVTAISATGASASTSDDATVINIVKAKTGATDVYRIGDARTSLNVSIQPAKALETGRIYTLEAKATDANAHTTDHFIAVLQDPGMRRVQWGFGLPTGAKIELQGDGTILIDTADSQQTDPAVTQTIILRPWARDINGKVLPTAFSIAGNTLVQSVVTTGATYPIIVDPGITGFGYYGLYTPVVYVQWSKSETKSLNNSTVVSVATAAGSACGDIPNSAGKVVCAALVANKLTNFSDSVEAAASDGECLKARVPLATAYLTEAIDALNFYEHTC